VVVEINVLVYGETAWSASLQQQAARTWFLAAFLWLKVKTAQPIHNLCQGCPQTFPSTAGLCRR